LSLFFLDLQLHASSTLFPYTTLFRSLGSSQIRAGEATLIVAGGMESMSNAPYLLERARTGYRIGDATIVDAMIKDGLWDPYHNRSEEHTSELQSLAYLVCRLLLEKKK